MENIHFRTDEELVKLFRGGDGKAGEELLFRYKNKVLSVARRFFLAGGDTEDLVQEGMCGLYSAITSYGGDSGFSSYAHACIKNRIIDAVKKSGNSKNTPLNCFLPLSEDGESGAACGSVPVSPEEALIDSEAVKEFSDTMKRELSPLEYKAVCLYIDGATMTEISAALGKTYKQTDNALARAKNKLRRVYQP